MGKLRGYLPHRWPAGFDPELVDFRGSLGPFPAAMPLTEAGDVHLVSTPGHTAGHLSVVVRDEGHDLFLAGDTSYTEANLLTGRVDGVSSMGAGEDAAGQTLARIRAYAAERPTVYLPSHDPAAADRLANRTPAALEPEGVVQAA
jgi:glyoxylase-like metal-dependent hydrolase (beta-lactamase superfamily II)